MEQLNHITKSSFISIGLVIAFIIAAFFGGRSIGALETRMNVHEESDKHPGAVSKEMIEVQYKMISVRLSNIERRLESIEKNK